MAEAILFNLAREILSKLGSPLIQQFGLTWAVKKELRMLENKISTLRNVLLDAQHRQITNLAVKDWLRRLKLVFYDADDLLDEVATEALTRQVETHKSMMKRECEVLIRRCFERDFFMIAHVPEIYIDGAKVEPSHYNISKQGKQLFLQGQSWSKVLNVKDEHDFRGFSNVDTKFWT